MSTSLPWLLYGANGYTGRLIAEQAVARGEKPILAGRSREAIEPLAAEFGLEHRVFALETLKTDPQAKALDGVGWVLHCAGPFIRTSKPLVEACLRKRVHYLDITGEVAVFEALRARDAEAKAAGVLLLPGIGTDVVPTDCLAARLKALLPSATHLKLALKTEGKLSPGTSMTVLLGLENGSFIRADGKLVPTAFGARSWVVEFDEHPEAVVSIPWGDLSTAHFSTGIPNIEVYVPMNKPAVWGARAMGRVLRHPKLGPKLRPRLEQAIKRWIPGSSPEERESEYCVFVGEVSDPQGQVRRLRMVSANGYVLTAEAALAALIQLRDLKPHPVGYQTPSTAFGAGFAETLPDVRVEEPELPPDTAPGTTP